MVAVRIKHAGNRQAVVRDLLDAGFVPQRKIRGDRIVNVWVQP